MLPPSHGDASPANGGSSTTSPPTTTWVQDIIHYTMTDAEGATSAGAGSTLVNVVAANAPTCPAAGAVPARGRDIVFQTTCSDAAHTPLNQFTYALVPGASPQNDGWIDNHDGTFTLHPLSPGAFVDSFTYTATSFAGTSNPAT